MPVEGPPLGSHAYEPVETSTRKLPPCPTARAEQEAGIPPRPRTNITNARTEAERNGCRGVHGSHGTVSRRVGEV